MCIPFLENFIFVKDLTNIKILIQLHISYVYEKHTFKVKKKIVKLNLFDQ